MVYIKHSFVGGGRAGSGRKSMLTRNSREGVTITAGAIGGEYVQ